MNRIITILVTIFILLLLYIWISHVWGGDKPRHPRQIVDARETGVGDDLMSDADSIYNGSSDSSSSGSRDDDETYTTEVKKEEPAPVTSELVKSEPVPETKPAEPKKAEPKVEPKAEPKKTTPPATTGTKPTSTPPKPTTSTSSATAGMHLVIAGNFTQLTNAQQRMQELKKAGFGDAEVINFDLSEYHTVCAGRFSDVNEARKLVRKLKDYHKIDAYVRIGG